jgi:glutathione S-transferase
VQRAVIVLRTKHVEFDVTYINLREKPQWFLDISPHGKVPVLSVDGQPLFESNAIAEFLDEVIEPQLHPQDPIKRARNRAWTDFVPEFSRQLGTVTYAKDEAALEKVLADPPPALTRLDHAIANERGNDGPYFNGADISLVDAAYAPFLQRFNIAEDRIRSGLFKGYPLLEAWSDALLANEDVRDSVSPLFDATFDEALQPRGALAGRG